MAARAIWKADLVVGKLSLPIKLYSAAVDRRVHFRLVHAADSVPLKRQLVHPETGDVVESGEAQRGVRLDRGHYVVLEPEELKALEPEAARKIEVTALVGEDALDERWFERPYYLGPEGDSARYFALSRALAEASQRGIASWTLRGHAYRGLLLPVDGALALVTLRSRAEVLPRSNLAAPEGEALPARELDLAAQLLRAMTAEFDWSAYRDQHRARVEALVAEKRAGKVRRRSPFKPHAVRDAGLAAALQRSLKQAG
jgi:DNA end-binding protein Ku